MFKFSKYKRELAHMDLVEYYIYSLMNTVAALFAILLLWMLPWHVLISLGVVIIFWIVLRRWAKSRPV